MVMFGDSIMKRITGGRKQPVCRHFMRLCYIVQWINFLGVCFNIVYCWIFFQQRKVLTPVPLKGSLERNERAADYALRYTSIAGLISIFGSKPWCCAEAGRNFPSQQPAPMPLRFVR
jgi:hypothetical protein